MSLGVVPLPGPLPVPASGSKGDRSKTFWPFLELMKALSVDNRATRMIVLENVCSALTSHVGRDFAAIGAALSSGWYRFDGLVIDAHVSSRNLARACSLSPRTPRFPV